MKKSRFTRKFNVVVSLCVCIAMLFSLAPAVGLEAYGASGDSLSATKGVYYFDPHEVGPELGDLTDTFIFDEELLKGDSLEYNDSLATMTFELAVASISSEREKSDDAGYANKSRNLRAYLEDNGFVDFDTNEDYRKKPNYDTMGVACAHKKIVDDGKEYTLIALVPRSAGYESEWGANFKISDSTDDTGDSAGFRNGRNKVLGFAREYIEKYGISGDIKVWTAGYSRGAGVTNQVGAALVSRPENVLGDGVNLTPGNVYCYTFGTPKSASTGPNGGDFGSYNDEKFKYVHNVYELYDIVTVAPPAGFGFNRYGSDENGSHYSYADKGNKDRMLWFLEQTNPAIYDLYKNGGDPDKFKPKTIEGSLIDGSAGLTIVDYEGSIDYLPKTQAEFMQMMDESVTEAVLKDSDASGDTAREKYYNGQYQQAMYDLCGYMFAHLDKTGSIVEGIEGSKYVKPMAASLYISYMLERYNDEIAARSDEQLAILDEALKALVEAAGGTDGVLPEDAPKDIKDAYNKIVEEIEKQEEAATKWANIDKLSRALTTALFRQVFKEGLDKAGIGESETIYNIAKKDTEARALSRILSYLLLYDTRQTSDTVLNFETVTDQVMHMATFMGNASSFMRPHNNEVILSWLRTLDSNYDDFTKENAAQKAGYRRLYIDQPDGVSVTATVKDGSGNTVAVVKDGVLTSRTDKWIGVTTCDTGNWIRIPADQTYRVELKTNKNTKLNLKATEYNVDEGKVVREVTSDKSYNWKGLQVNTSDKVTWVISAIPSDYKIASNAYYYIEKVGAAQNVLVAKGTAKGKRSAKITWNKISGAERYVIYMSKCNTKKKKYTPKKVKTVGASKQTWTRKLLKKGKKYKFYVVAQKKVNGKYVEIARSRMGHVITNNRSGKYTNPKALKLSTSQMSLAVGKTGTITGSVSKMKAKKKLMYSHEAKLRFTSTNPTVAKVDANGKVTAVAAGSCTIYVQTINGMWKTVSVTVK